MVAEWAGQSGHGVEGVGGRGLRLRGEGMRFDLSFETANALEFLSRFEIRSAFDLVIAQAFLDLVDLDAALPLMAGSLKSHGLLYLCINFDGGTIFDPPIDEELDRRIEDVYHRTMDERTVGGEAFGGQPDGAAVILRAEEDRGAGAGCGGVGLGGVSGGRRLHQRRGGLPSRHHRYSGGRAPGQKRDRCPGPCPVGPRATGAGRVPGACIHRSPDRHPRPNPMTSRLSSAKG